MDRKLLLIGSSLNYGSPGKITENIGLLAKKKGWQVYQAHGLRYSNQSQLETYSVSSKKEEYIHMACSLLFDAHGLSSVSATKKLCKWIDDIKPDIIHLHNLHGYYLNYRVLFEYLSKIKTPIVWTLHDFWPITGHCAHFDYVGCYKWKNQCYDCPQVKSYPRSLFLDRSRKNYDIKKKVFTSVQNMTIVPVSMFVGNLVKQSFLGKYSVFPIYNGVDTNIFKPYISDLREKLGLQDKFVLLGVASPWYLLKGTNDYIELSKRLPLNFQIVMVGLSKKQIRIFSKYNILGIEKTESQKELAMYYSMADVVLNLSYQETFGMTTIEGMSCGTPSIVYDKTASPELVTKETGLVVAGGNIETLVESINEIKSRGKSAYSMACRERAKKEFDKNSQFEKYMDLYSNLINANR